MQKPVYFVVFLVAISCTTKPSALKTGLWRGVLEIQGEQLPFNFEVKDDATGGQDVVIYNAGERLLLDEIFFTGDSVNMVLHVFDAYLRAAVKGDSLSGVFNLNYDPAYKVPFKAKFGQDFRFIVPAQNNISKSFTGKYKVQFFNEKDTSRAIALIQQTGTTATGSFLTSTGDYRYLEGSVINDTLYLSTFDGNHAYLFEITQPTDSTLDGSHWSGKARFRKWAGKKNENARLPDAESLTYLKEGYDKIEFSFPDLDGNKVGLNDERFKNKVVILQLSGTWCPNCMDETRFLAPWYDANKNRGVEIIGLAYERKDDFAYASERVKKMKEKFGVNYEYLIAGVNDNAKAAETLPMLNKVVAFPTTIFIGKDGKVKHIHTGFDGPGTGIYYEQFKERFNAIVNELLNEK
ncbi:MAG: TlpA family protein disulfide reductase [Cyclobacteriaceae bacterium]|nr:TlpA family protein disulfide reductase [Cyclobacteriaceae bacterium]